MAEKIRWGILSTANIAKKQVIPAIQSSRNGVVAAVASRNMDRAKIFANELGIPKTYGSYDDMLADPDIDAIYNPLPNDGHAPWSIAAAKAKKPTLVEKPISLQAGEAHTLVEAFRAENVLLAEAFMYRYHPQHVKVKELLAADTIGTPNLITACFTYSMAPSETENVRLNPTMGGGGLMDVGCYCVNACRMLAGSEPLQVMGQQVTGATSGVDELFVGLLVFPNGVLAHIDCGMRTSFRNQYSISGPKGVITVSDAFRPINDAPCSITVSLDGGEVTTIEIPAVNQYRLMVEDFGDAVRAGRKTTYDPEDSIKNMRVLAALAASAHENRMITVAR